MPTESASSVRDGFRSSWQPLPLASRTSVVDAVNCSRHRHCDVPSCGRYIGLPSLPLLANRFSLASGWWGPLSGEYRFGTGNSPAGNRGGRWFCHQRRAELGQGGGVFRLGCPRPRHRLSEVAGPGRWAFRRRSPPPRRRFPGSARWPPRPLPRGRRWRPRPSPSASSGPGPG